METLVRESDKNSKQTAGNLLPQEYLEPVIHPSFFEWCPLSSQYRIVTIGKNHTFLALFAGAALYLYYDPRMETVRFLYNDGEVFAVYKPPGLHTVQLPKGGGESLADRLITIHPLLAEVSKNRGDAGLINRLDEDTSGIVVGAWSRDTWNKLFEALLEGKIHKTYQALVEGHPTSPQTIHTFLGSPHRGAQKIKVYEKEPPPWARALPGTTDFTTLRQLPTLDCSLIAVSASPARRHQVRAHSAYRGHPLVGDALYGSTRALPVSTKERRAFFLHADTVSFAHPSTGEPISITAPARDELELPE